MCRASVDLSVIIPAYNERERIERTLQAIIDYLVTRGYSVEVIVVDDGSVDGTYQTVSQLGACAPIPIRAIRYSRNAGEGCALKVGFSCANGKRILFTDADLSTPIEETSRLMDGLQEGFEIVIGSRKVRGAGIDVHQPWYREWMGRVVTRIVQVIIATASDVTCGFKLLEVDVGREIFSRIRIYDWAFDPEVLMLARTTHCRVNEVPVVWRDEPGTKVRLFRDVLVTSMSLLRIRLNAILGLYTRPFPVMMITEEWSAPQQRESPGSDR